MQALMDIRKPTLEELKPLFAIAGVILNTADIVSKGIPPTLLDILLPSLATTYGSALITNSVTQSFSITPQAFLTYLIGLVLSLYLYSNKLFLSLISEVPMVSKVLSSMELVKSQEETGKIITCQVTGFFVGMIVKKLVLRRSMRIKRTDLMGLTLYSLGIYIIRLYHFPPISVLFIVYPVPIGGRLRKYFAGHRQAAVDAMKRQQPIGSTPIPKPPRRKASVASQLNIKNKKL